MSSGVLESRLFGGAYDDPYDLVPPEFPADDQEPAAPVDPFGSWSTDMVSVEPGGAVRLDGHFHAFLGGRIRLAEGVLSYTRRPFALPPEDERPLEAAERAALARVLEAEARAGGAAAAVLRIVLRHLA